MVRANFESIELVNTVQNLMRRSLEKILKDKTRKRSLPQSVGGHKIYASSAGGLRQLLMPMDKVDPDLFLTASRLIKEGDTVWDIGANVGLFSFSAMGLVGSSGEVVSFEPDAYLVSLLRKSASIQADNSAKISIIPAGIAGTTGVRSFHIAKRARASNALSDYGNQQKGGVRQMQSIICLSLEDALSELPPPAVVKIDVEGAEVEILSNGQSLLSKIRPRMAVESAPSTQDAITQIFKDNDYVMFDANGSFVQSERLNRAVWNTLAIPAEKLDFVPK